ncbi:hypothetical protein CGI74_23480 [Vibrio parahaemolyticus]|uniref:hypothetical protein n=2 Tax=Vibrio parahaemolyticus TaxID=670 RepID=UPI00111EFE72|nr:hypothetical protein [Vibrio parahaemolyticus]TOH74816.1 hypothetical protein CGI74_23480 [Vibrio parahaemolyticus]
MKQWLCIVSIFLLSACASQKPSEVKVDVYTKKLESEEVYLLLAVYYTEEVQSDFSKLAELFDKKANEVCSNGFSFDDGNKLETKELVSWYAEKHFQFASSNSRFDSTSSTQKVAKCKPI